MVYTAASQTGVFYVDGKPDSRTPGLTPPNPATSVDLHIGRDSFYPRYFLDGMLDDVAIFYKALSPAEVADISEKSLKDVLEVREALEELAAHRTGNDVLWARDFRQPDPVGARLYRVCP